jgi:GMP synthase (glutamine-hydrolysing)
MTDNIHKHRILILDFGSQYTQLVARRVRELGVYCELWAWDVTEAQIREFNPKRHHSFRRPGKHHRR